MTSRSLLSQRSKRRYGEVEPLETGGGGPPVHRTSYLPNAHRLKSSNYLIRAPSVEKLGFGPMRLT